MHHKIQVGTDVAAFGLWDHAANGLERITALKYKEMRALQDEDIAAGRLLVIDTGADGGGKAEVYVDERIPADNLKHLRTINREYLIRAGSGRLVLGGMEDYRSEKKRITGPDSQFNVEPGPYRVRLHVGEGADQVPETELIAAVGEADYQYHQRAANRPSLGCLGLFAGFIPVVLWGWSYPAALAFAIASAILGYWLGCMLLSMDERYRRVQQKLSNVYLDIPYFVLELERIDEETAAKLFGGRVEL